MDVSANVLQVMCIRLGVAESGLGEGCLHPAARRTLDPHDRYRGSSADLWWLESQATGFVQANVRSR